MSTYVCIPMYLHTYMYCSEWVMKVFSSGVKFGHLNARPAVWAHGVIKTC